jgi:uncharacterized protein YrzB (UPF0473 family)
LKLPHPFFAIILIDKKGNILHIIISFMTDCKRQNVLLLEHEEEEEEEETIEINYHEEISKISGSSNSKGISSSSIPECTIVHSIAAHHNSTNHDGGPTIVAVVVVPIHFPIKVS